MKKIVVEIDISSSNTKKEDTITFGTRMPKSLAASITKHVPKEKRAELNIEFWSKVVKEYAS